MKRWVTAALLSGALALTACEAEPAEPTEPSSSAPTSSEPTSAAPTTEPTGPVEPTLPPEAEQSTKAGAEAFVKYYWEVVNHAQKTGDTGELETITLASCSPCNSGREWIEKIYGRGGTIAGGVASVDELTLNRSSDGDGWMAAVAVSTTKQRVRGAGDLDRTYDAGSRDVLMVVRLTDTWRLTAIEVR